MKNPELLAPAGNPEALDAAIGEGADAVYLGLKTFNARLRSSNFAYNQFEAAVDTLHRLSKKIYVTVNTVFEEREADRMYQFLQYIEKVGPDGIIVQDYGVARMAREHFPGIRLHASTQMNVASAPGANFLSKAGFKRVVLARELSLEEIKSVRQETNLELETFVHGALCVSVSGVCMFSSYLGGKSANRGACAQACRRLYANDTNTGYFFSPDDFELVGRIPDLAEAGVTSLKIEGRMKSADYVGTVVAAYRYMLDNFRFDRERSLAKAQAILQGDFARRKTTYFFDGEANPDFIRPEQAGGTGIPLGEVRIVRVFDEKRWMLVNAFDGIAEGDSIRIHRLDDSGRETAKVRAVMQKPEGLFLQADASFGPRDSVYLIQTRSRARRYKPVLPNSFAKYHKFPSWDKAPPPASPVFEKAVIQDLPDGLYVLVDKVADLHVILAARPEKAVIRLNRKNAELLRKHEKELPFKRESLILWLEPFFPQADAAWLADELEYWESRGQRWFVANNFGHLTLLRGLASGKEPQEPQEPAPRRKAPPKDVRVIAGPFLYAFNSWSASFLLENGADFLTPPLEGSKQNFFRVTDVVPPKAWMVMVFEFPALFTVRADLGKHYDFRFFSDREGGGYELVTGADGSTVIPSVPASLVDRIPFLKKSGFGRFLLDFSFIDLKKQLYRQVMKAAGEGTVIPETGRFNWKDGFWNPEELKRDRDASDGETDSGAAPGDRSYPARQGGPGAGRVARSSRGGARVGGARVDGAKVGGRDGVRTDAADRKSPERKGAKPRSAPASTRGGVKVGDAKGSSGRPRVREKPTRQEKTGAPAKRKSPASGVKTARKAPLARKKPESKA